MRIISGPIGFAGFLVLLLGLQALLLLYPHALVVNGHEGDLMHTIDAATRLSLGEWPHSGFMTPLGVLAFAPVSLFMALGFGPGTSFRLGMLLVAAVLLPVIWYVGETRMGPRLKYFFGAWLIIMTTGLVYGGDQATSSISMYYNRWAWSVVFLIVAVILLPSRVEGDHGQAEGALMGVMLALLVLIKVTCFVAVAPAVALYFLLRRDWEGAIATAAAGLVVALAITIAAGGPGYWLDYLRDLLFLAQDSGRSKPGLGYSEIIANPSYLPGSVCLFASIVLLRMFRWKNAGLLLLVLAPGLFYITFQNWGNDPTWLVLLGVIMLALRPDSGQASIFSTDLRAIHNGVALAALVLISTSMINVSYSTLRSAVLDRDLMFAAFPNQGSDDLLVARDRAFLVLGKMPMPVVRVDTGELAKPPKMIEFAGETFGDCAAQTGLMGIYQTIAADMHELGLINRRLLVTDVVNPLWMLGAGARIAGLAPWYYGDDNGLAEAEYIVVALCPFKADSRKMMLEVLEKSGAVFEQVVRKPHYVLFKVVS